MGMHPGEKKPGRDGKPAREQSARVRPLQSGRGPAPLHPGVLRPMEGARIVTWGPHSILFGQPPEVLKSMLNSGVHTLDTIVLPDKRERGGVLLNNLEFPLYYFLFYTNALKEGRKLRLVGDSEGIAQIFRHLHLTLLGPSEDELRIWGVEETLRKELMNAAEFFAVKDADGAPRSAESFFEPVPFIDNQADLGTFTIHRLDVDHFRVNAEGRAVEVDLNDTHEVNPPYIVNADYTPNDLVNFGVTVLGGASGFSPNQASTGLALCFDGNYIVIDSIPYFEQHILSRGISKNQIRAVFLTHLHDDHCNMFPLMLMPHKTEVITTRAIFNMAMEKLAMGLGWDKRVVAQYFDFIEIVPGETLNYYGLRIDAHYTVHSIPTIGATFSTTFHGHDYQICVVGDNQSFDEIELMRQKKLLRQETVDTLRRLYAAPFDILIADGGMGEIHGDPADALRSEANRVLYVHVDELPEHFDSTFSLATAGKRYTVVDGDSDIYTTRAIEYVMSSFGTRVSTGWLNTLFADKKITRYNREDVILKQGAETSGRVILILTGCCDVIRHDGFRCEHIATREAGDFIGEMAVIAGRNRRSASVVARTPVVLCEFSEATFEAFVQAAGFKGQLLESWARRAVISELPQFEGVGSTVVDRLARCAECMDLGAGETVDLAANDGYWTILSDGTVCDEETGAQHDSPGEEFGPFRPFTTRGASRLRSPGGCTLIGFPIAAVRALLEEVPVLSYRLRTYRGTRRGAAGE